MERYVAFDVETPNARNHRMSAIGVCVVEDGEITRRFYTLVNPETYFDAFNIRLTSITPAMVRDKLTFAQLWPLLEPLLDRGILLAHNAVFDLGVLARCLKDYGIDWKPRAEYACTVRMARRLLPEMENHRLNTMCDRFHISLRHHNAGSDAEACARLLLEYRAMGADLSAFTRMYDFSAMQTARGEMEPWNV